MSQAGTGLTTAAAGRDKSSPASFHWLPESSKPGALNESPSKGVTAFKSASAGERWPSGHDHPLLLQRTQALFPAPTLVAYSCYLLLSWGNLTPSGLCGHQAHMWYIQIYADTHIHIK